MPEIESGATRLTYDEQGDGLPLVLVHGALSDMRVWSSQTEVFARKYRTVAFSFRHYHPNQPIPEGVDLPHDVLVEDLTALLDELDLAPAHLVGQSSGAFASLLLARDRPDMVRTLVLAEPPALPLLGLEVPPRPSQIVRLFLRDPATAIAVARFGARGLRPAIRAFERGEEERGLMTFINTVLGKGTVAGWSQERLQRARDNVAAFKALLRGGMPVFGEDDVRRITAPSLLVTGERSASVLHRITDRLETLLPDVERVDIPGASHLMFEEQPEAFNSAVLSFLERHSP